MTWTFQGEAYSLIAIYQLNDFVYLFCPSNIRQNLKLFSSYQVFLNLNVNDPLLNDETLSDFC